MQKGIWQKHYKLQNISKKQAESTRLDGSNERE